MTVRLMLLLVAKLERSFVMAAVQEGVAQDNTNASVSGLGNLAIN